MKDKFIRKQKEFKNTDTQAPGIRKIMTKKHKQELQQKYQEMRLFQRTDNRTKNENIKVLCVFNMDWKAHSNKNT